MGGIRTRTHICVQQTAPIDLVRVQTLCSWQGQGRLLSHRHLVTCTVRQKIKGNKVRSKPGGAGLLQPSLEDLFWNHGPVGQTPAKPQDVSAVGSGRGECDARFLRETALCRDAVCGHSPGSRRQRSVICASQCDEESSWDSIDLDATWRRPFLC